MKIRSGFPESGRQTDERVAGNSDMLRKNESPRVFLRNPVEEQQACDVLQKLQKCSDEAMLGMTNSVPCEA